MDSETARLAMSAYIKEQFGKIVTLREILVKRSSSGRIWVGEVYCLTSKGEIDIGHLNVDESGQVIEAPSVDNLIEALAQVGATGASQPSWQAGTPSKPAPDDFSDLLSDDFSMEEEDDAETLEFSDVDQFFANIDHKDLRAEIVDLLSAGKPEDLESARQLMPQLLADPVGRGTVLRQMGELEYRLNNDGLALEYFEAAAREFADRGDLDALHYVAETVSRIVGEEEFEKHLIKKILEQTNFKLQPMDHLDRIPAFAGLGDEELFEITGAAELIKVGMGEIVLKEGDPAVNAFVIKSGLLQVELETPDGTTQLARCCFPGEFVGETSVLEKEGATCNATVVAKQNMTLWRFNGERLKALTVEFKDLKARIEEARTLHRVDSFFAMNEAIGMLDHRVRDQLLGCICAIKRVDAGTVLGQNGKLPDEVFLISKGTIEYRRASGPPIVYEQDAFVSLGDTLHELILEGDLVAASPCRLLVFDTHRLKSFAAAAPADVVAVLERLG